MDSKIEIKIVSFGIAKEILKDKTIGYSLNQGSTIKDLRAELSVAFPAFTLLKYLKFAVNEEYVNDERTINDRDEIYLIPPVSGG
jgi:molybdopterin converting factor small subunit